MLTKEQINENFQFMGEVIRLTTNNLLWSTQLKPKCYKDLFLIENISVGWSDKLMNTMPMDKQNQLNDDIMKLFLKWYTMKNKLRSSAWVVKPDNYSIDDENNVTRSYKGRKYE